jgi:HSF-type DNA-binding
MLEDPTCQEYISWLPHGRAWKILKQHEFEEKVVPLFFRHAKHSSFMRQVNGWGFRRILNGPNQNAYYHAMFIRGRPSLCIQMRRPPNKLRSTLETDDSANYQDPTTRALLIHVDPHSIDVAGNAVPDTKFSAASAARLLRTGFRDVVNIFSDDDSHKSSDSDVCA